MSPKAPTVGEGPFEALRLYALRCRSWPDGAARVFCPFASEMGFLSRAGRVSLRCGTNKYNLALSARRAEALKNLLTSSGIDSADITAVGMGEKKPIADNSTKAGQAINRRGEFVFKAKSPTE